RSRRLGEGSFRSRGDLVGASPVALDAPASEQAMEVGEICRPLSGGEHGLRGGDGAVPAAAHGRHDVRDDDGRGDAPNARASQGDRWRTPAALSAGLTDIIVATPDGVGHVVLCVSSNAPYWVRTPIAAGYNGRVASSGWRSDMSHVGGVTGRGRSFGSSSSRRSRR